MAVNARIARTPPIPARISCLMRCSWSPPYSRSVTLRRSCSFSGMSESSSSSGTRPTCATQTRARSRAESGMRQLDQHRFAGGVGEQPQRQTLRVERRICLVLPAVGGQRLPEIAASGSTGRPRSAAGPGPTPPSGGRRPGSRGRRSSWAAPRRRRTPSRSTRCRSASPTLPRRPLPAADTTADGSGSRSNRRPARSSRPRNSSSMANSSSRAGLTAPSSATGSLPHLRPQVGVDGREQVLRRFVPRPAQVDGQLVQRGETVGEVGTDGEPAKGFHASLPY